MTAFCCFLALGLFVLASVYLYVVGLSSIARGRKYKSGTGWCVWRWTDVDSEYILRLHVLKTPWWAICLHWINKPDAEPWLHDHPVSFFSVILRGHYVELRRKGDGPLHHKLNYWFNFVRASDRDRHRIVFCRANTLTLCFMGPKKREWGFHVWEELQPSGWIYWKDYYARLRAGENMRGTDALLKLEAEVTRAYRATRKRDDSPEHALHYNERTVDAQPAADFSADEVTWAGDDPRHE